MNNSTLNKTQKTKHGSIYKTILKIVLSSISLLIVIILLSFILFYICKNDISRAVIDKLGELQQGELTFQDISLSPFVQFPSISIRMENLSFFEHPWDSVNHDELPIAYIEKIYVAFNLIDLIRGKINVPNVTIVGGNINIITYADSSVNLLNALGKVKPGNLTMTEETSSLAPDRIKETKKIIRDTAINDKSLNIDLSVDVLTLKDLKLSFKNFVMNRESSFILNELKAKFIYREKRILSELNTDIEIENISYAEKSYLNGDHLDLNTRLTYDEENNVVEIEPSQLTFGHAQFDINGNIDLSKDGLYNINVNGSDHDFSFFSLVLSNRGIANLESGDFYFNGSIKGKESSEFPIFRFSFGLKNVNLLLSKVNKRIKDFNFTGYFNSGSKKDLSEANLQIQNLQAVLPDGYLNGSFNISNFVSPFLDLKWNMKTSIDGFEETFKLDFIKNLTGTIEIVDTVKGHYNADLRRIEGDDNRAKIICNDLSFNLPGIIDVQKFDGIIKRNIDQFELINLKIISDDTDLLINGTINNIHYLIFNEEKKIDSELKIKSKLFDLPNFLSFDPSIGRDFPYRIKNIDMNVEAKTTTSKLMEFKSFPQIDFSIKKMDATIENFLPPLYIKSGEFKVSESILGFNMKFNEFNTDFAGGNLNFTSEYNSSKKQPFYIKGNFDFDKLNPGKIFYTQPSDTIPEIFDGSLNGSMFVELQFPEDSSQIKLININKADLNYFFADDTISTKDLKIKAEDIYFDLEKNGNPLATLTTDIVFEANEFLTNNFRLGNIRYDINCNEGTYVVHPKSQDLFGSKGIGEHTLKPFDDIPFYRLKYSVRQFNSEDLLKTFLEDTVITGKMDFSMDISMSGNEWDSLVSKLNGEVLLRGKNITMYGVDTDKLIEKFKRSQSFNLVDVGAVVLAGPVGLAVTKGTDFASIVISKPGQKTLVTKLVSDYNIHNGKLIAKDVAFTTEKNRIAAKGWLDFTTDSLKITIAVLDKNGCSIFSQDLFGPFKKPKTGNIQVVGTLMAPVTNLWNDIWGNNCDVFYHGSLAHPIQ